MAQVSRTFSRTGARILRTSAVKFVWELQGLRTISNDVLQIAVRPYVNPQEQEEADIVYALKVICNVRTALIPCDLHTHYHELNQSYTNPEKWNWATNHAGGCDSGYMYNTGVIYYSFQWISRLI